MAAAAEKEKCVMVVGGEARLLALLRVNLELEGLRVIEALNPAVAIGLLKKERPDLIMLDIVVPEKDGIQALKQLAGADEFARIPVILLAARGGREELAREAALGARGHITKPFDTEQMVRTVKAALGIIRR